MGKLFELVDDGFPRVWRCGILREGGRNGLRCVALRMLEIGLYSRAEQAATQIRYGITATNDKHTHIRIQCHDHQMHRHFHGLLLYTFTETSKLTPRVFALPKAVTRNSIGIRGAVFPSFLSFFLFFSLPFFSVSSSFSSNLAKGFRN